MILNYSSIHFSAPSFSQIFFFVMKLSPIYLPGCLPICYLLVTQKQLLKNWKLYKMSSLIIEISFDVYLFLVLLLATLEFFLTQLFPCLTTSLWSLNPVFFTSWSPTHPQYIWSPCSQNKLLLLLLKTLEGSLTLKGSLSPWLLQLSLPQSPILSTKSTSAEFSSC